MAPSILILCGRVDPSSCAEAIGPASDAYARSGDASAIVVEYDCPPGAWCSWRTRYIVAFLVHDSAVDGPWPPTFLVTPRLGEPGTAEVRRYALPDGPPNHITDLILEAGWIPASP